MARAADIPPRPVSDPNDPESQIREYIRLSQSLDELEARKKVLRETLMSLIDEEGIEDDKGNVLYEFSAPIDGVLRLEKQRRVKRELNEEAAEGIIESAGLSDDVYKMVRVIDEDALMASFYEGKITEEQLDEMFPVQVIWALRTPKK
jgi:hypothetical protein